SGFYAPIEINLAAQATSFELNMQLNGSSEIFFIPVAKENNFKVSSIWADPSFKGSFIPDNHHITPEGFTANWNINEMNRSIPDVWTSDSKVSLSDHDFGIELIKPVDNYQKSTRAVKYAILFIGLTFLTIFFKEVIQKENIHPVQYLIVGCALVIFYSVLISLAEHVGFNLAYWISSAVIISMIGFYTGAILKKKSNAMIIALILSLMYSFLFVVLQISDYALLVGNMGILAVLGMVMYFSRKIDWYNKSEIIER
ncbi:MAG: cell envelope integrity protein CreD, partial [Bacteroidales bacterium]|nr:cell envelope integrity protein CreD [Bacteroidales bacterium]